MILILPLQLLQPSRCHGSAQPPNHFISSTERDGMSAQRSSSVGGLREPRLPPSLPAVHQRPPDIQSPTVATARTHSRRYAGYLRPHLPTDRPTSGPQESCKTRWTVVLDGTHRRPRASLNHELTSGDIYRPHAALHWRHQADTQHREDHPRRPPSPLLAANNNDLQRRVNNRETF